GSMMTIVLVSRNSGKAYFQREEIQTAINLSRQYPGHHKVIPVYLDGMPDDATDFMYGLRLIQGIDYTRITMQQLVAEIGMIADKMKPLQPVSRVAIAEKKH